MTQLSMAREGTITDEMRTVAKAEGYTPEEIRDSVATGRVVIPKNINHDFPARGIGKGLTTKTNANIGTSMDHIDLEEELDKLKMAVLSGADSVMDLSTGGDLRKIRKAVLDDACLMVGAVPLYLVAAALSARGKELTNMTSDMLFDSIEEQCEQGVDYITVHCGVTQRSFGMIKESGRIARCRQPRQYPHGCMDARKQEGKPVV